MQDVARLITHFIPENYQLSLQLDRPNRRFNGIITVYGVTVPGANKIILHAKNLEVESVILDGKAADFAISEDELTITHKDIAEGKHIIVVVFAGTITDAMHGLYPCYFEHDGVKKELLATQFESHHAREVFPCIDEPEAKATFEITLTTEPDVTILGNMPIKQQSIDGDHLVTTFQTTPRMSTYLVAWIVGELHRRTSTTTDGVEVNVWATLAQSAESLDFALEHALSTIEFFNGYFGVPYPLPKSDHVALPDFTSGAMENWGLIAYREAALLVEPKTAGISTKQYVALVIAHELSHQWFGNLVTMKWWNNLWLNESFATLMEYIAVNALHPEWNMWLEFSTMESILALRRDSIDGVQPVQVDVHHPDEIGTLFDGAIVYAKGARLLRMLQQYIGQADFQAGLKAYFEAYAYQNTEGDDLWSALSAASGKDIAHFMDTWISQPGYPVVEVDNAEDKVTLSQKRFFIGPHEPSSQLWPIPLNGSQVALPKLFDQSRLTLPYDARELLRLNIGDSAHFITKYSDDFMTQLIEAARTGALAPLDRLQLLHEQTLLARGGMISSATLIPLLRAYKKEIEEAVWGIIALATSELRKFIETSLESEQQLRAFYIELAHQQYERLGWEAHAAESESDTKLRATIIGMMLYGKDSDTISHALELYKTHSIDALDSELRPLIIGTAVRESKSDAVLHQLIELYRATPSAELRDDIASGLTSVRSPEAVAKILTLFTDNKTIRPQDLTRWFAWTIRNRYARDLAWQWLRDNWEYIRQKFEGDKSYDYFPRYAASALQTPQQLQEYRDFFTPMQSEPSLTRVITLGISEIEGRIELIERDSTAVQQALREL
jgi:aminopeptidase N